MLLLFYPRESTSHYLICMCPLNRRLGETYWELDEPWIIHPVQTALY